jgi:hypothetical protein
MAVKVIVRGSIDAGSAARAVSSGINSAASSKQNPIVVRDASIARRVTSDWTVLERE